MISPEQQEILQDMAVTLKQKGEAESFAFCNPTLTGRLPQCLHEIPLEKRVLFVQTLIQALHEKESQTDNLLGALCFNPLGKMELMIRTERKSPHVVQLAVIGVLVGVYAANVPTAEFVLCITGSEEHVEPYRAALMTDEWVTQHDDPADYNDAWCQERFPRRVIYPPQET